MLPTGTLMTQESSPIVHINQWPIGSLYLASYFLLVGGPSLTGAGEMMPEFNLMDVNPTSSTYQQSVSPRDFLGGASGWYFGHST